MLAERGSCLQVVAAGMCCFCSCKSVQVFELCAVIATGPSLEAASCSIPFLVARMGAAQSSDGGSHPAQICSRRRLAGASTPLPWQSWDSKLSRSAATTASTPLPPPLRPFRPKLHQGPCSPCLYTRPSMGMAPQPCMGMAPGPSMGMPWPSMGMPGPSMGATQGRPTRSVQAADLLKGVDLPQ